MVKPSAMKIQATMNETGLTQGEAFDLLSGRMVERALAEIFPAI